MNPEHETQPLPERRHIEMLPEVLGYQETEELTRLSEQFAAAMKAGEDTKDIAARYLEQAEAAADSTASDNPESHKGPRRQ